MHGDTPLRQFAAALALAVTLEFATGESTMSTQITVVLVSGLPGSGKSMLAECLRQRLSWPLLAKDNLKEILFDTLGVRDRDWSRQLSKAAYALMFRQISELINAGCSCVVEGNFRHGEHETQFGAIAMQGARLVQAHCHAPPDVLLARFRSRMQRRHAGHADAESLAEIESETVRATQRPLAIGGAVVDCENDAASSGWPADAAARVIEQI